MTIGSVTGATQQFLSPADDDSSEGTFNSVSGRIAVLLLDTQENQKETDRQQLSEARRAFSAALDDEVAALRERADATFRGACFEGAAVMASGGFEAWGALSESQKPWQKPAADGLARLAEPLGDFVGHNYGAADAKAAAGARRIAGSGGRFAGSRPNCSSMPLRDLDADSAMASCRAGPSSPRAR